MTDEMLSQLLSGELNKELGKNEPEIIRALLSVLPKETQIDDDLQKLLIASIHVSVQLSIQLTVRMLENAGLLSLPPDGAPILHIVPEK